MVTDLPIILLTLFVLSRLAEFHGILGAISIAGGVFLMFMGYESLRTTGFDLKLQDGKRMSLRKGILTNVLSPHPYLFWVSVGAPTMARASGVNLLAPAAFIVGFYACLVGSKIVLAVLVGRSRSLFRGKANAWPLRRLGAALMVLALLLFRDGVQLSGLLAAPKT
jgi:threonine/homoserine/homoserine lactone efflux protein